MPQPPPPQPKVPASGSGGTSDFFRVPSSMRKTPTPPPPPAQPTTAAASTTSTGGWYNPSNVPLYPPPSTLGPPPPVGQFVTASSLGGPPTTMPPLGPDPSALCVGPLDSASRAIFEQRGASGAVQFYPLGGSKPAAQPPPMAHYMAEDVPSEPNWNSRTTVASSGKLSHPPAYAQPSAQPSASASWAQPVPDGCVYSESGWVKKKSAAELRAAELEKERERLLDEIGGNPEYVSLAVRATQKSRDALVDKATAFTSGFRSDVNKARAQSAASGRPSRSQQKHATSPQRMDKKSLDKQNDPYYDLLHPKGGLEPDKRTTNFGCAPRCASSKTFAADQHAAKWDHELAGYPVPRSKAPPGIEVRAMKSHVGGAGCSYVAVQPSDLRPGGPKTFPNAKAAASNIGPTCGLPKASWEWPQGPWRDPDM